MANDGIQISHCGIGGYISAKEGGWNDSCGNGLEV